MSFIKLWCSLLLLHPVLSFSQQGGYMLQRSLPGIEAYGVDPDAFSFLTNRASLASIKQPECALFVVQRFMMNEFREYHGAGVLPTSLGNMGAAFHYSRFLNFSEQRFEFGYARTLGSVEVGIGFSYFSEKASGYRSLHGVNAAVAMRTSLGTRFTVGWQVMNFPGVQNKTPAHAVWVASLGLGYKASDDFLLAMEVAHEQEEPVNAHVGFCYNFHKSFFAKGGVHSDMGGWYGGAGWLYKKLRVLVTVSHHPYLGVSPGMALYQQL